MNNQIEHLIDIAIAIQQIPAPTFHEEERARFVQARFKEEGLANVSRDEAGNVHARLAGSRSGKKLVVCAHLDTVFPIGVNLHCEREAERIHAPGIGDNSMGVAGLFGLAWTLREKTQKRAGDVWLVANVCEEGLGDLRGMRAVVDRFGNTPLAYIILEGMALGQIYHRGLGVCRYRITVQTSGGHSWIDYGQPSAIHELTAISTRLTAIELPRSPRTTLNIGIISGGSSVNTIAAEAMLELDLRSEDAETLDRLGTQVEQIVHSAKSPGVSIKIEIIGQRPSGQIPIGHPLVSQAKDCLLKVGIEPHLNIGSTDANLPLSRNIPAVTIGLTTGGRGHSVQEYINLPPLESGMNQVVDLVSRILEGSSSE
jgi:tripeptide aminopeptidase